jgi:hypothetical protein
MGSLMAPRSGTFVNSEFDELLDLLNASDAQCENTPDDFAVAEHSEAEERGAELPSPQEGFEGEEPAQKMRQFAQRSLAPEPERNARDKLNHTIPHPAPQPAGENRFAAHIVRGMSKIRE